MHRETVYGRCSTGTGQNTCRRNFEIIVLSTTAAFIAPITAAPPMSFFIAREFRTAAATSGMATATTGASCAAGHNDVLEGANVGPGSTQF